MLARQSATILGIDPGSRFTGYGFVKQQGPCLTYLASGHIRTDVHSALAMRLKHIFFDLTDLIKHYQPTHAAIEQVFVHRNPHAALKLGQARGAATCALTQFELYPAEYSARQVKQAVTAYGAAHKAQVQFMVGKLLNLASTPQADAADALAVAICHAHTIKLS